MNFAARVCSYQKTPCLGSPGEERVLAGVPDGGLFDVYTLPMLHRDMRGL